MPQIALNSSNYYINKILTIWNWIVDEYEVLWDRNIHLVFILMCNPGVLHMIHEHCALPLWKWSNKDNWESYYLYLFLYLLLHICLPLLCSHFVLYFIFFYWLTLLAFCHYLHLPPIPLFLIPSLTPLPSTDIVMLLHMTLSCLKRWSHEWSPQFKSTQPSRRLKWIFCIYSCNNDSIWGYYLQTVAEFSPALIM